MPPFPDAAALFPRGGGRARPAGARPSAKPKLVDMAFSENPGALRMLVYAPEDLPPGAPLVVTLHGCTQTAEGYAGAAGWLTLADRNGFAVLAPEQASANNPNRCFNWFEPGDVQRGQGEAASIRAMVAEAVEAFGLDPGRVYVTGLSAGGAMAAALLATYPDVFAGGAVIGGLPYGVATSVQSAFSLMSSPEPRGAESLGALVRRAGPGRARLPRISIWHGDADATVKAANAGETAKQWISAHGLEPRPARIERLAGRTRSSWLSPETGEALVETNIVHGMGHGTPLSAGGPDGLGHPAPFMLEAGVSSSLEIAGFWGIAERSSFAVASQAGGEPEHEPSAPEQHIGIASLGDQVMAAVSQHVPADVKRTIADALRAAGLRP